MTKITAEEQKKTFIKITIASKGYSYQLNLTEEASNNLEPIVEKFIQGLERAKVYSNGC